MSGLIERQHYTFGNDKFCLEDAYHDCKLVFDGITDDDSFQKADDGLILYYANEIIYALHEALQGVELIHCKDCEWWTKQDKSLQGRCELMQMYPTGGWFCGNAQKRMKDGRRREMSEELKPCPFCGSEDVYLEDASDKFGELWVVGCNKCFVALSAGSESSKGCVDATREQTIAAWNRRAK